MQGTIDFSDNIKAARKYVNEKGHPLNILTEENAKIWDLCQALINNLCSEKKDIVAARKVVEKLVMIEKHYKIKKEAIYIPLKEKYGVFGPNDYMGVDDAEVVEMYKDLLEEDKDDVEWMGKALIFSDRVLKVVNKEKNILFSAVARNFTEEDYAVLRGMMI